MEITEICNEALRLSKEERAELAGALLDTLDGADPNDADENSLMEARQRGQELASGEVMALTEEKLFEEVQRSRKR